MILFEQQLILNSSFLGTLVYNKKKKITDDLLTISETFTWFYKIENIVMHQIEIDCGSDHTPWNIGSAILKILFFFEAWLNS